MSDDLFSYCCGDFMIAEFVVLVTSGTALELELRSRFGYPFRRIVLADP